MATRVRLRPAGMKALLTDPGVARDLRRRGEAVLSAARANAPEVTGDFIDSLSIVEDTTDRTVVRVVSTDPGALVIEARTGAMTAALDAAGG